MASRASARSNVKAKTLPENCSRASSTTFRKRTWTTSAVRPSHRVLERRACALPANSTRYVIDQSIPFTSLGTSELISLTAILLEETTRLNKKEDVPSFSSRNASQRLFCLFFFYFSSFHGGMVWVFTEDKKYPSCARFLLFGLEECMICACMQR